LTSNLRQSRRAEGSEAVLVNSGVGFVGQGILTFHATVAEGDAAAAGAWASRPRRGFLDLFQRVPQRSACVTKIPQHLVEEIGSEYLYRAIE
jgi:hypothetical protein